MPKKIALDEMVSSIERDRIFVINQAINAHLEVHSWQLDHIKAIIKEGLHQAATSSLLARK